MSRHMVRTRGEIIIHRPPEEVFDRVADERNVYDPSIVRAEKISAGPIGLGTRFRSETRALGGRTVPMTIEITAYDRPRHLASTTYLSTMEIDATITFDPVTDGTRMRWLSDLKPRGLMKLLSPLLPRLGSRQEQRIWGNLKRALEARET